MQLPHVGCAFNLAIHNIVERINAPLRFLDAHDLRALRVARNLTRACADGHGA